MSSANKHTFFMDGLDYAKDFPTFITSNIHANTSADLGKVSNRHSRQYAFTFSNCAPRVTRQTVSSLSQQSHIFIHLSLADRDGGPHILDQNDQRARLRGF